jgi:hypothetical protein|tara:strand:+ start:304 stop:546 length:243 start_codon:yes stop_codon:yes gene_type:complete
MPKQSIKFTITQDGTVIEEVQGAVSKQCLDVTLPFERALGNLDLISREFKPEYYNVSLQQDQNKTTKQVSINRSIDVHGI